MPLLHCPKCCPKHTIPRGSCSHIYDASEWQYDYNHPTNPYIATKATPLGPWGWRCENCGHFKKPRQRRRM